MIKSSSPRVNTCVSKFLITNPFTFTVRTWLINIVSVEQIDKQFRIVQLLDHVINDSFKIVMAIGIIYVNQFFLVTYLL